MVVVYHYNLNFISKKIYALIFKYSKAEKCFFLDSYFYGQLKLYLSNEMFFLPHKFFFLYAMIR